MKKKFVFLGIIFSIAGVLFSQAETEEVDLTGLLSVDFRSLQPGEVLWVRYPDLPKVINIRVRFREKTYNLERINGEFVTPVGLDLGINPGNYPMQVVLSMDDGSLASFSRNLEIQSKEFPVKKLWVEEKFVSPPAEVTERIRRESQILNTLYSLYTQEWLGDGSFIIPCGGEIFPNFGERRFFNNKPRSQHSGVDISAPSGTPLAAANSGRVVLATNLYFCGNAVIIDHGMGVFSIYCHLSKLHTKRGEMVSKGDIVGEVGATGRVTGPHLHWSVKIRGSRVDPISLVSLDLEH